MNRRVGFLGTLTCLVVAGASRLPGAFAQGMPAPGPGGTPPPADGGGLLIPGIILVVALLGGLILAVTLMDVRRKRRAQAVAIEGQIEGILEP